MSRKPKESPKIQVVQPPPVSQEEGELIEIADLSSAWGAWSAGIYDPFQPFDELGDNALAAIMFDPTKAVGNMYIKFDFEKNTGSIEHSGGTTFPHTADGLVRCLTYGGKQPSSLNEHGCGLKTSLAILDPNNQVWEIWIKTVIDGNLRYFRVKAPYSNKMRITKETNWPGKNQSAESGSFIQFPIKNEQFKNLYSTKNAKMTDKTDLHNRIKCHFSHLWMKIDPYINGNIRIFYNEEQVQPFSFLRQEVHEHVQNIKNKEPITMTTGGIIKIEEIKLKVEPHKKIPGSYTFKYAMETNGVYVFKNGRLIEQITSGDLYKRIFGCVPDPHHNGTIIIANMIGEQKKLPRTVPTKNRFGIGDLFNEFIDLLRQNITPFPSREHISEDVIVEAYKTRWENTFKTLGDNITLAQEKTFHISDTVLTPQIDLVQERNNIITLMEFKASPKLQNEHIAQILFNWLLSSNSRDTQGKIVNPVIILRAMDNCVITDTHKQYLQLLKEKIGFNLIIRNNKDEELYRV